MKSISLIRRNYLLICKDTFLCDYENICRFAVSWTLKSLTVKHKDLESSEIANACLMALSNGVI